MEIKNEKPPIWDSVCQAFEVNPSMTLFTYGDTIYNPSGQDIPDHLMEHEELHAEQQKHNDNDAALWWGRYLREPMFRLDQESKAYAKQYAFICNHPDKKMRITDRNKRFRVLHHFANSLSGPLYGRCISHAEAMQLIKKLSNVKP